MTEVKHQDLRKHVKITNWEHIEVNQECYGLFILQAKEHTGAYSTQDFLCPIMGPKEKIEDHLKSSPRKKDYIVAPVFFATHGKLPISKRLPYLAFHNDGKTEVLTEEAYQKYFQL